MAFGFLLLYFLLKYLVGELNLKEKIILVLLILILPLSHSTYPSVYTMTLMSLALMTVTLHMLSKVRRRIKVGSWIKPAILLSIILFATGFLWNFMVNYPSPVSSAFGGYMNNLLNPKFEVGDIGRFEAEAAPFLPEAVRPEPWTVLLLVRNLLLCAPIAIVGVFLACKLLAGRIRDKVTLSALLLIFSFAPVVVLDYISGWYPLRFRYYAFPLIAYSFGLLYGSLAKHRVKFLKLLPLMLTTFLVTMAFLSPFWHIYYPRQLYDPEVEWKDVGFPNPHYVNFGKFAENNAFGDGIILSDFEGLLAATLPVEELRRVRDLGEHYGEPNTYIVEFVGINPPLGYSSPEDVEELAKIRNTVDTEYSKILDSSIYTIYCK